MAFLLADLAVTKSHSRPYVSDDNPYSEIADTLHPCCFKSRLFIKSALSENL